MLLPNLSEYIRCENDYNIIREILTLMEENWGEDNVDASLVYHSDDFLTIGIIVHYPDVIVTNEYDESLNIKDLYVRFGFTFKGRMIDTPELIRSTFTLKEWKVGYMHSHVPRISEAVPSWSRPCFGRGPINTTISTLLTSDAENANIWRLFMSDLDDYVTVESVSGIPYIRLSNVTSRIPQYSRRRFTLNPTFDVDNGRSTNIDKRNLCKALLDYYIPKIAFDGYSYVLGESTKECMIEMTRQLRKMKFETGISFPENDYVYENDMLLRIIGCTSNTCSRDYLHFQGEYLFTFKEQDIHLNIDTSGSDTTNQNENGILHLVGSDFADYYLGFILSEINYRFNSRYNDAAITGF